MHSWIRPAVLLLPLALVPPRLARAAEAAEVTCKDGTTSHAGKGACSGHGGVDKSASASTKSEPAGTSSASKSKSTSSATATTTAPPEAAEVTCKDGTTSHAGKGACSGHGGVDKSGGAHAKAAPTAAAAAPAGTSAPAAAAPPPAAASTPAASAPAAAASKSTGAPSQANGPPTAKCKDGSLSYAKHHSGACSDHGGVAQWLDATSPH